MIHLPAGIAAVEMDHPSIAAAVIDAHGAHIAYCPHEENAAEIARALNQQILTKPKIPVTRAPWNEPTNQEPKI